MLSLSDYDLNPFPSLEESKELNNLPPAQGRPGKVESLSLLPS
jgi:hypothetical protein